MRFCKCPDAKADVVCLTSQAGDCMTADDEGAANQKGSGVGEVMHAGRVGKGLDVVPIRG